MRPTYPALQGNQYLQIGVLKEKEETTFEAD